MNLTHATRCRLASLLRRALVWVALVNYTALTLGLPIPAAAMAPGGLSGEAYPCRDHRCGCVSAEQCWKSCCCFSHDEKMAWAERHGVTPPAYVIALAEVRPVSNRSPVRKSCCSAAPAKPRVRSCCSSGHDSKTCEVADSMNATSQQAASDEQVAVDRGRPGWVSYLNAARCRGVSTAAWLNVPISLPTAMFDDSVLIDLQPQQRVVAVELRWDSLSFPPADPPPRVV
ncbi:MAG: hypothetical protein QM775_24100 [Pirellulales bacterium]